MNQVGLGVGMRAAQFGVRLLQRRDDQRGLEAQTDTALPIGLGQLDFLDMLERTATAPRTDELLEGIEPPEDEDFTLLPTVRYPRTASPQPTPSARCPIHMRAHPASLGVLTRVCALVTAMPVFGTARVRTPEFGTVPRVFGTDPRDFALRHRPHPAAQPED
eukprot:COSAG02_NODE_474_length_21578_cov_225.787746_9_plen_162_part_00